MCQTYNHNISLSLARAIATCPSYTLSHVNDYVEYNITPTITNIWVQ